MHQKYYREIAEHFIGLPYDALDEATLNQLRRALVNYLGGSVYAASHDNCKELLALIKAQNPGGRANIFADAEPVSPLIAACANAARLSSMELNDSLKASAHPGIYVWSAVLATWQAYGGSTADVLRAVLFGYEVCTRMAQLSIAKILELGLHNPGFVGALAAASAAGLLRGFNVEQLCNAFGIAASLLPVCPFVSFVEGTDSKDLYGGWGAYLGMFATEAAARGLTGPRTVLNGVKALDSIFQGESGSETELGKPYGVTALNIKEFSACFAINPAVKTVFALKSRYDIDPEQIESVLVDSYPYSYDLNEGVGRAYNSTSARLSLYYTVAVALAEGELTPDAFLPEKLGDPKYRALADKITAARHDAYGEGPTGIRGCVVEIRMKDGRILRDEIDTGKIDKTVTDEKLRQKFMDLTRGALESQEQLRLYDAVMRLDAASRLEDIIQPLLNLKKVR